MIKTASSPRLTHRGAARQQSAPPLRALAAARSALLVLPLLFAAATGAQGSGTDYTELRLEDLMELEVYSVSKKAESRSEAAAAVFVITEEDIRRHGIQTIPEALRLAPGLDVAQIDANTYAVSSRGFNAMFTNKLLVLIDGRSVYTPLFSGVYWSDESVSIDDVKQIEVIRGPGATLWGANAVNGVINIVTKPASETQGLAFSASTSRVEDARLVTRFGSTLGQTAHYRISAEGLAPATPDAVAHSEVDEVRRLSARLDWQGRGSDSAVFTLGYFESTWDHNVQQPSLIAPYVTTLSGTASSYHYETQLSWTRALSATAQLDLRLAHSFEERNGPDLNERRHNLELDFQHPFAWGERQDWVWGLGYLWTTDEIRGSFAYDFLPASRSVDVYSAFLQDEVTLIPRRWSLIVGSKLEQNAYTGFEIQPNLRTLWTPSPHWSLWASASRAVRTPSRADSDVRLNSSVLPPEDPRNTSGMPILIAALTGRELRSEVLFAYETGVRGFLRPNLSMDLALFHGAYNDLRTTMMGETILELDPAPSHLLLPLEVAYNLTAQTSGAELSAEWWLGASLRIVPSYTYFHLAIDRVVDEPAGFTDLADANTAPNHQLGLRTLFSPRQNIDCSLFFRSIGAIDDLDIDAYRELDATLIWRLDRNWSLSLGGKNLLADEHQEFSDYGPASTANPVLRIYVLKVTAGL